MIENLNLNTPELEENLEDINEEEESFKSFSLDEFTNEISTSSGIESSNVKNIIQAFVQINLKNLKLR